MPRAGMATSKTGQASPVKFLFPFGEGGGGNEGSLTLVTSDRGDLVIELSHGPPPWCNPSAYDSSPLTFSKNV